MYVFNALTFLVGVAVARTTVQNQCDNSTSEQDEDHCDMSNVQWECSLGPGRRMYNNGERWNPANVLYGNVDPNYNCNPCCTVDGTTLRKCRQKPDCPDQDLRQDLECCRRPGTNIPMCDAGNALLYSTMVTLEDS